MTKSEKTNIRQSRELKKIGIITSGGDAPGMNAAIRAVTRAAIYNKLEVVGINHGYKGMVDADFRPLSSRDVSGILQQGGTILKTARCAEFRTKEGREKAYQNLQKAEIDALVVIGGDGSFTGALIFSKEFNIPIVGIPGTIDNDIYGTEYTIGYDTALNTVVQAVDKIKDTAASHGRIFFIEVMGREAGLLALNSGIAIGAEVILIPESTKDKEVFERYISKGYKRKKTSGIVVIAEGDKMGGAIKLAEKAQQENPDLEIRVSILGHMQRGGSPTAKDRIVATRIGIAAIEALLDDQQSIMIGLRNNRITHVPFSKAVRLKNSIDTDLLNMQEIINI
ncbi:6-phosphofructokinase [uncultured Sunxiuqinia sp.]|uniref:6-phosphofructokinase n=1 Tax=Sunxiuqinia rutila TaxID=1397841 RepID=UPI00260514E5|nr:6-phosphofructokinase [uncultured Sunxiuqinia sp.]